MTRKDYIKLVGIINSRVKLADMLQTRAFRKTILLELTGDIADMLAQDTPRFSRDKFIQACGLNAKKEG